MKTHFKFVFFLFFSSLISAQESIEITGSSEAITALSSEELPFWFYTNRNGFLNENSSFGISAFAKAKYDLNQAHQFELGIGGYLRNGFNTNAQRSDLYINYTNNWITATLGAKSVEEINNNLSTINGTILNTGNTRPIPGVVLETSKPISITNKVSVDLALGHYRLNDDRDVRKTNIHYKSLSINLGTERQRLQLGLDHYVQWGGVSPEGEEFPDDLKAFAEVFLGRGGTGTDNSNESINALGNHLGSYKIKYSVKNDARDIDIYHQTLFEDRSGRELNNFPDGVWGLLLKPKNILWLECILYEYVQTISQSGRPRATDGGQQSGGDNYFSNSIYTSGWQYENRNIGLPFIVPSRTSNTPNNRIIAHHLGAVVSFGRFNTVGKLTYLQGLGTFGAPIEPRQKSVLSYLSTSYTTEKLGSFTVLLGADITNYRSNTLGGSLGYVYML